MNKQITKQLLAICILSTLIASISAQVSTDATAAYGLRKLNPGYSGKAIQVRRSCDNATMDIGFTACGDLDTAALKTFIYTAPPVGALAVNPAAAYGLRRLGCSYNGSLIRVRRSCDNAETDIGFTANGDLDTVALKNFVFGAGPLNMITPVANVAYSLRRMRCAYAGSAIRVRRSSDNTTQDIGFTVSGDLDTAALKAFVGAGNGFVNIWYDQSGNAKNLSQSTAGNQPQIVSSGTVLRQNGKPTVRFTASSTQTLRYSGTISSGSGSFSLIAVSTRNSVTLSAGSETFGWGNNSSPGNRIGLWNDINTGNNCIELLNRALIGNSTTAASMDIKTWIYSSGNISTGLKGFYNGSSISTTLYSGLDITPNVATNEICMGAVPTTTAHPYDGNISEVVAFTSSLNTADRQTLEYLQSQYYGIAGPATVSISSTSADAYVTKWYNQTNPGNYDLVQATMANQPRIMKASVIERNGTRPAIYFSGAASGPSNGCNLQSSTPIAAYPVTLSLVANTSGKNVKGAFIKIGDNPTSSGPNAGIGIGCGNSGGTYDNLGTSVLGLKEWVTWCPSSPNVNYPSTPFTITTIQETAGAGNLFSIFLNGTNVPVANSTTAPSTGLTGTLSVGGYDVGASYIRYSEVKESEVYAFGSSLSTADRQFLEFNQAQYFGISGPTYVAPTNAPSGYVTTWYDQTGNGNHITQATSSRQPVIVQAGKLITINGKPAMRSSSVLQTNLTGNLASTYTGTGLLANAVYQTDTTTSNNLRIMSTGNGALLDWNENGLFNINHRGGSSPTLVIERNAVSPSIGITTGTGGIVTASFSGTQREITGNGTSGGTVGDTRAFNFNKLRLFQSFNNSTFEPIESFTGRLSEYVLYTKAISNTRRTILENNEAEYYGITISNDKFPPVDQSYNRTINGIGFQSSSDSVQRTRVSRGFIIEDNAASATNFLRDAGDYIMAGVNCNIAPSTSTANLSQNVIMRWTTDWEVKRTDVNNNGGSVKFIFDFGDYWQSAMLPGSAVSNYVLLKRSASNGTFDTLAVTSKQVSGDQVIFTLNASNINTFFTLGTVNSTLAPLPMELTDFRCNKVAANRIDLSWTTASETNNDHFTVERSADGKNFKGIGIVKGAGNSSEPKNYSLADYSPIMGTAFYRVKQTDYNGTVHYSNLCAVNNFNGNADGVVKIYPNPASASLTVELGTAGANRISLINSLGEEVYSTNVSVEQSKITLDCSKLVSGIYMVQIHTVDAGIINRKVIIQN